MRRSFPFAWFAYDRAATVPREWHGTLAEDKADEAGTLYRRARYYEPTTGRFTQEDPIGLAGGLNLYGFAGGDPVNFSDPFGLCPPIQSCLTLAGAAAAVDGPLPVGDVAALGFLGTAAWLALQAGTGDIALPHAKDAERRREQAVFHPRAGSEEIALVQASGELWGRAPRNMTQSTTPAAKAYSGPLPAGARGYE